jgi:hypothetical protein
MRTDFASDADLTHLWATKYRIPLVHSSSPGWSYEVALVVPEADGRSLERAVWPTEDEAELIGHAIEFRMLWYREGWRTRMRERPLDVDGGTNTVVLLKDELGWHYRRHSWTMGPRFFPPYDAEQQYPGTRAGLLALLDERVFDLSSTWPMYKAEHGLEDSTRQTTL